MKAGKVWGETRRIAANGVLELHRIRADAGHECSKHKHKTKFNGFFVEKGELEVWVWQPTGLLDVTVLVDGEYTEVPPGLWHKFVAKKDTIAFELYWAQFCHDDIERETQGT